MNEEATVHPVNSVAAAVLSIYVPGAPVPCARARVFTKSGSGEIGASSTHRTAAYEKHVKIHAQIAANQARWKCADALYVVWIDVYRAANRGDVDNYFKALTDPMRGVVYPDDRMIVEAHVYLYVDRDHPCAKIRVEKKLT